MPNFPQWLQNIITLGYGYDKALETYYLGTDKDLANKAAYKALGLDPREAPVFGWNNMSQSVPPQPVYVPQRSSPLPWLLSLVLLISFGAFLYFKTPERSKMPLLDYDTIAEELEADPAFAEEIRTDFMRIQAKITEHRTLRKR